MCLYFEFIIDVFISCWIYFISVIKVLFFKLNGGVKFLLVSFGACLVFRG